MGDQAYFVGPPDQPGFGVLLLPSWYGAVAPFRRRADALADEGFTVLAPDLNFGARPTTEEEAERVLAEASPDRLAGMVQASAGLLADRSAGSRIGVVGFGMGGSLALWLSVRRPDLVAGVVSVYGHQSIDFDGARAAYQVHVADQDPWASDDDMAFMEATMGLAGLDVDVVRHEGLRSGFADDGGPRHDEGAADRVWARATEFLARTAAAVGDADSRDAATDIASVESAVRSHLDGRDDT